MMNKASYLTICEFYFLIIQRNLQGLVIFEEIKEYIPTDQEMAQGVLSLMEKGILAASEDGCYHLSETMNVALDILEGAKSTFVINGYLLSCPMQCFYFGGDLCLVLQMDDFREGFVRIEIVDRADAVNGLLDYEFMPDLSNFQYGSEEDFVSADIDITVDTVEMVQIEADMLGAHLQDMDIEDLLSDESILLVLDRYLRNSISHDCRAVIFSKDENYYLIVSTGKEMHVEMFDGELFTNLFVEV